MLRFSLFQSISLYIAQFKKVTKIKFSLITIHPISTSIQVFCQNFSYCQLRDIHELSKFINKTRLSVYCSQWIFFTFLYNFCVGQARRSGWSCAWHRVCNLNFFVKKRECHYSFSGQHSFFSSFTFHLIRFVCHAHRFQRVLDSSVFLCCSFQGPWFSLVF